jgi:ABC-2 type transport system permease protein
LTIFKNNVKRIFLNKVQLFFIILFPIAFMMLGFIGQNQTVKVAILDKDQTKLTSDLVKNIQSKAEIRKVKENEITKQLKEIKVDYVLVIQKGFTEGVIHGEGGGIEGYSVKESNFSKPVSTFLEQWIGHAKSISEAVHHDQNAFYTMFTNYDQHGSLQIEKKLVINPGATRTRSVLGYVIIAMLYTSLVVGLHIILNKNNHTLYRTLAAPITIKRYMVQTICSFLFISFIQITFVMMLLKFVFRLYMGTSFFTLYLLLLIFALVSVSFGVAISSVSKNVIQACLIGICLIGPMAMLGGAYFPLDWAPEIIKTLSHFTPVSWVINGVEMLLYGQSLHATIKEMSILILFAMIFFLLGTLRKVDISKGV